jgi:hypothetical protein
MFARITQQNHDTRQIYGFFELIIAFFSLKSLFLHKKLLAKVFGLDKI